VNTFLRDNETGKSIDLRSTASYSFDVTSQNMTSLANRFVLEIGKTRLFKNLEVSKTAICFNDTISSVVIHSTQPEVEYKATLKGVSLSDWTKGTGSDLEFGVSARKLATGNNLFTMLIRNSCRMDSLETIPTIKKSSQPVVTQTIDGLACQTGETTLQAFGAKPGQVYNWFKSIDAMTAFEADAQGKLALHGLTESAAFYVSIRDSIGCESERVKVNAKVVNFESVSILQQGDTLLISNHETGNTWFRNGVPIEKAVSNMLRLTESGIYSDKITFDGCVSRDSVTVQITGINPEKLRNFIIYPNPAADHIVLYLNNYGQEPVCIDITSETGTIVYNNCSRTNENSYIAIPAQSFAQGLYIVRVTSGKETKTKRIIKL
jgi:hypothetical protein